MSRIFTREEVNELLESIGSTFRFLLYKGHQIKSPCICVECGEITYRH